MIFLGQLKKSWSRSKKSEDAELQGDRILSEMLRQKPSAEVKPGHEEKATKSLESVYTIETIDVKTVRPLSKSVQAPPPSPKKEKPKSSQPQMELNLGNRYGDYAIENSPSQLSKFDTRGLIVRFVLPWVDMRGGIAARAEIEERWERLGLSLDSIEWGEFISLEEEVYASHLASAELYQSVVAKAKSYFYRDDCQYLFAELINWCMRDFARSWEEVSACFIKKSLFLSKEFALFKNQEHELWIRLR